MSSFLKASTTAPRIEARVDEEHARLEQPRLSPDGRRVAFSAEGRNIWIRHLDDGTRTQLTTGPTLKWLPFWSPDGKYVYYAVEQPGRANRLERQPSAGGGKPETIVNSVRAWSISTDGRWLAYSSGYGESGVKLFKLRLDGDRTPSVLLEATTGPADSRADDPAISPDQRFVAYVINGSMSDDGIYVRRLPDGDGQWQLDAARGAHPRWSVKGDRLYFDRNNELWEIEVRVGTRQRSAVPAAGSPGRIVGPGRRITATTSALTGDSCGWQTACKASRRS